LFENDNLREKRKREDNSEKNKKKRQSSFENCRFFLANDSNFDRNPLRGCNYGLEGGAFLILGGCSSLPKEEERLHEIMC